MRSLNHSATLSVVASAINSDSIVEWRRNVYFLEPKEILSTAKVNIESVVEKLSFILDIELASEYPSSTLGNLEYWRHMSLVLLRYPKTLPIAFQCWPLGLLAHLLSFLTVYSMPALVQWTI
uniref:Uncharacterized protein n=1 Tax=Cannabis sativa TaxID=3483 RepID=A0A803P1C1_CANSA